MKSSSLVLNSTLILLFLLPGFLYKTALASSADAQKDKLQNIVRQAIEAYERCELEKSYNNLVEASLFVARELQAKYNNAPLEINEIEFKKELEGTDSVEQIKVEPVFNLPDEFLLIIHVENLNREESKGRFRFHLKQYLRIYNPAGTVVLDENPVNLLDDYKEFMTELKITNRVPVLPEWTEGEYRALVTVEDGLESRTEEARIEKEVRFTVRKKQADEKNVKK